MDIVVKSKMIIKGKITIGVIFENQNHKIDYYQSLFLNKKINNQYFISKIDGFVSNHDINTINVFFMTDEPCISNIEINDKIKIE